MTGAIVFDTTGLQNINKGTFDNSTGGYNGISLTCAVGYELNWQGGHLVNWYSGAAQPIYVDSPIDITNASGITFSDDSVQTTAALPLTGGTLSGAVNVTGINNTTNTNIDIDVYNDTGAGTHFVHSFDAYTGVFELATNGGGITFPDSTTQTTAWTPARVVNQVYSGPYTIQLSDANKIIHLASGSMGFGIGLNTDINTPYVDGTVIFVTVDSVSYGYSIVNAGASGVNINGASSFSITSSVTTLIKVSADFWYAG
jgi:hypothetical protein